MEDTSTTAQAVGVEVACGKHKWINKGRIEKYIYGNRENKIKQREWIVMMKDITVKTKMDKNKGDKKYGNRCKNASVDGI